MIFRGHFSRDCPLPKDWSKVQCNNCKEFGHTVARCKAPKAAEGDDGENPADGSGEGAAQEGNWGGDPGAGIAQVENWGGDTGAGAAQEGGWSGGVGAGAW